MIGESPDVRYSVCLIASTFGSAAAWARKCWTLVEKESYGWCRRMSRSRSTAKKSVGLALSTSASARGVRPAKRGNCRSGRSRSATTLRPVRSSGAGKLVDLGVHDPELAHQQLAHLAGHVGGQLEPDRRAEPAPQQLLLQGLEEVLGVVLLDLEVLVAGDPERVVLHDLHPGEEVVQVGGDELLERNEAHRCERIDVAVDADRLHHDEPGQRLRHLDPSEVLLLRRGVAHDDGEVEREARDVGERVRRVDGERREHREDLPPEVLVEPVLLLLGQAFPVGERDALRLERRDELAAIHAGVAVHQLVRAHRDRLEDLAWGQAGRSRDRDPGRDAALETGHTHHEELVQVRGEDRREPAPLQERQVRVLGQLEHTLVEREPGQLTVGEPVLGQLAVLGGSFRGRDHLGRGSSRVLGGGIVLDRLLQRGSLGAALGLGRRDRIRLDAVGARTARGRGGSGAPGCDGARAGLVGHGPYRCIPATAGASPRTPRTDSRDHAPPGFDRGETPRALDPRFTPRPRARPRPPAAAARGRAPRATMSG